jgi:hypothetical protein
MYAGIVYPSSGKTTHSNFWFLGATHKIHNKEYIMRAPSSFPLNSQHRTSRAFPGGHSAVFAQILSRASAITTVYGFTLFVTVDVDVPDHAFRFQRRGRARWMTYQTAYQ